MWALERLGEKPSYTWNEAVIKYLKETTHKASHDTDIGRLRWLDQYLGGLPLASITRDKLSAIAEAKAKEFSPATANRLLALIRAILRKAAFEWEWLDKVPKIRMLHEPRRRIRWITREEAESLLSFLPKHQAELVRFALATGMVRRYAHLAPEHLAKAAARIVSTGTKMAAVQNEKGLAQSPSL